MGAYCKDSLGSYTCPCHTGFEPDDFFESGIVKDYNQKAWDLRTSFHSHPDRIYAWHISNIPDTVVAYNDQHGFNDIDEIEWVWFPTICLDIDECKNGNGTICPPNSDCINTEGSYVCNCAKGPESVNNRPCYTVGQLRRESVFRNCTSGNSSWIPDERISAGGRGNMWRYWRMLDTGMDQLLLVFMTQVHFVTSVTLVTSNFRQIIVLWMQSAQIFREIIYANACQVSVQTQRQFSPTLVTILMSAKSFHLVMPGTVSKVLGRTTGTVRISLELSDELLKTIKCIL